MTDPGETPPPPLDVFAYLRSAGWDFLETTKGWSRWRMMRDGVGEIILEASTKGQAADYGTRFRQLLDDLRRVEQRSEELLLRDIRSSSRDVIKFRLTGNHDNGRIPVDQGARVFKDARDILLAAACAAVVKRPAFSKKKPDKAMEYVRRTQFGPTEPGSFVLTIESAVPPLLVPAQVSLFDEEVVAEPQPFDRQVGITLATAVNAARRIVDEVSASSRTDSITGGVAEGLTSNLCASIASLVGPLGASTLEMRFRWAGSRPAPKLPREVIFESGSSPVLHVMAKALRAEAVYDEYVVSGPVYRLVSDDVLTGGTIAVVAMEGHAKGRLVTVELSVEDYLAASKAHQANEWIRCTGELARIKGNFQLRNPRGFGIVQMDEDDDEEDEDEDSP